MWARIVEMLLAVWLVASPWTFGYVGQAPAVTTFVCAGATLLFAAASFAPRVERAHLLEVAVAAWMIAVAFLQPDPPPGAAYQNLVCAGLLVILFAVVRSRTSAARAAGTPRPERRPIAK